MKQFRRSRPEASREGVRRAKAILEGEKENGTGRRVLNSLGGIPPHPLLRRIEVEKIVASVGNFTGDLTSKQKQQQAEESRKKLSDLQKRQEFLRAMANFRPKETVFEAFATGGQKDLIYSSQVDKCANGSAAALMAMKSMRRQMKIARDKGGALVVAGSKSAMVINGELDSAGLDVENQVDDDGGYGNVSTEMATTVPGTSPSVVKIDHKRRLSKAERKVMKKNPNFTPNSSIDTKKAKSKRGADFRDDLNFIESAASHDTAAAARSRQVEAAMQPSASSNSKGSVALAHRIEENMLDIVGDENVDLVKRQRMMRWDKSKRKYVQTTVGDELSGESKSKKIRLESGQLVKSDKAKLGELYEKWQKKTNRSIGRVGIFDDVTAVDGGEDASALKKSVKTGGKKAKAENLGDEKKTVTAIHKERERKEHMKLKNMKKGDRRQLERKQRSDKASAPATSGKKGIKGKKGPSGRWKSNGGNKGGKR